MGEGKRFNLTEWIEDKRNRNIALIVVIVLIALALTIRVASHIKDIGEESRLPDGGLLAEKGDYVEKQVPFYLNSSISNPSLKVTMAIPEDVEVKDDVLKFSMNGVVYLIGDGTESLADILKNTYYKKAVTVVFGSEPDIMVGKTKVGYIGTIPAEFGTAIYDLQISTRKMNMYGMAYKVSVDELSGIGNRDLILYACSEEAEALNEAQVVMKEIAYSLRALDMSLLEEKEEEVQRPVGSQYFYPIDVYWYDASDGYTNTVMLITWDNLTDEPVELGVTGPRGQMGMLNTEYSMGGHYLYEFGVTNGGEYYIHGGTDKQLINATVSVMDMAEYLDIFHYVETHDGEVPDYAHNRVNEEED